MRRQQKQRGFWVTVKNEREVNLLLKVADAGIVTLTEAKAAPKGQRAFLKVHVPTPSNAVIKKPVPKPRRAPKTNRKQLAHKQPPAGSRAYF